MLIERITLSLVALGDDIERRVMMATQLMAAHGLTVHVRPWDGTRSSLLIANADDTYGRNAVEQVRRRGGNVLTVSDQPGATGDAVTSSIQVAELVDRIKAIVAPETGAPAVADAVAPPTSAPTALDVALDPAQLGGLLQVCLQAASTPGDVLASIGPWQVLIRRDASRIAANAHSDLLAAQSRLVIEDWTTQTLSRTEAAALKMEVTQSLDAFLITGCDAIADLLPPLPGNGYQLSNWPDLGALPNHRAALQLASALVKKRWNLTALATHCGLTAAQTNAFCWAMLASGLLQSDLNIIAPPPPPAPVASQNILTRLARRFGLFRSE